MRIAFVSDLHANRQAWNAVLLDLRAERADRIVCLGDIVGYGPSPADVFESVHAHVHACLLGNHDAALCGKLDESLFSDEARLALAWSRQHLNRAASTFCAALPLALAGPGFRCAHGDFAAPGQFRYVQEAAEALPSWQAAPEPLLFTGHTHRAALFVIGASGTPHLLPPQDFVPEPGKRYLVNPGSVGLPRDGDARAAYCLYDDATPAVYFRRVPFDLDGFRADLVQAGLDGTLDWFLKRDPRAGAHALRAASGFRPPHRAQDGVRNAEALRDIRTLRRRSRSWRAAALLAAALLAAAAAGTAGFVRHLARRGLDMNGTDLAPIAAAAYPSDAPLIQTPPAAEPGRPLQGWSVRLGNRHRQSAVSQATPDGAVLRLVSAAPKAELRLVSAAVQVADRSAVTAAARFRKSPDFSGTIALAVALAREPDRDFDNGAQFLVKEPNPPRRDGWSAARKSAALPARAYAVRLELRGRFRGSVEIADLTLSAR